MKTRIIHTRFWKDDYISNLNRTEKIIFIYLITNESLNMCGIYELPDKYICLDVGVTQPELTKAKQKFHKDNKIIFIKGWIKIVNHDKFNSYGKGMQEKALEKELSILPTYITDTSIDTSIHTRPNTEYRNKNIEIRNKNTENRIQKEEIEEVKIEKVEYGSFNDLTDEVIQEIAEFYKVPFEFVSERREDMDIWMGKDPRKNKYKNYKQALQKWVRDSRQKLISNNLKDRNNAKSKFAKMG